MSREDRMIRIDELVSKLYDSGELSEDDISELDQLLSECPEARAHWIEAHDLRAVVPTSLGLTATDSVDLGKIDPIPVGHAPHSAGRSSRLGSWVYAAAAAALIFAISLYPWGGESFGQIVRTIDCRWEGSALQAGERIGEQVLAISAGNLRFDLDCGASLMIQAPASLALLSPTRLRLERGRMWLTTAGQALTVLTSANGAGESPDGKSPNGEAEAKLVVECSTEIALSITPESSEALVIRGELSPGEDLRLSEGEAGVLNSEGWVKSRLEDMTIAATGRMSLATSPGRSNPRARSWSNWLDQKRLHEENPLLAHFEFPRHPNAALFPQWPGEWKYTDTARFVEGRFEGTTAIQIRSGLSGAAVRTPKAASSFTALLWIRIDQFPHENATPNSALILSQDKEWLKTPNISLDEISDGRLVSYLTFDGQLITRAHPIKPTQDQFVGLSSGGPGADLLEKWIQVGFCSHGGKIISYLNGERVGTFTSKLGDSNYFEGWFLGTHPEGVPMHSGSVITFDELNIFENVLSDDEVREIYELSRP